MKMKPFLTRTGGVVATMVMLLLYCSTAQAGGGYGCDTCGGGYGGYGGGGCGPAFTLVERTIYVPTTEMERRTINVTEFRPEVRQRTITVNRCVPETREVREAFTVLV